MGHKVQKYRYQAIKQKSKDKTSTWNKDKWQDNMNLYENQEKSGAPEG